MYTKPRTKFDDRDYLSLTPSAVNVALLRAKKLPVVVADLRIWRIPRSLGKADYL